MRSATFLLCALATTACLPQPRPAQPVISATHPAAATTTPPQPALTTIAPTLAPSRSPASASYRDPTLFAQQPARPAQPYPPQPAQQQPYPPAQPQPYPPAQQQPYPPAQPQPYPPAQPQPGQAPAQPYPPAQPQPYPQPYPPQQPYPQPQPGQPQPYPPPAPYPAPGQPPYAAPYPAPAPPPPPPFRRTRLHNGEVIAGFAGVGALAAIDILLRQDIDNGGAGTLVMMAGVAGGGSLGWLLTEKYPVDAGAAHATTIGLLAGTANGALLIRPTEAYDAEDVMGLLFLGSAIGAGAGFAYGQAADLTPGQATFIGNTVLLGLSTAALIGITGSRNGEYNNWENGTLAIGLDAGILAGALVAPSLDWSPRRAKTVLAATAIGALLGGALPGLITKREEGEDYDGDIIAGSMTAGLWAGFGLGILMTRDIQPDPKYGNSGAAAGAKKASTTSYLPFVGDQRQIGLMAGGTW